MKGPRETVIAIDLLRVAAAVLVVAYHFGTALPLHPGWQVVAMPGAERLSAVAASWTWFGWVGVEIFFVISGLVIAASAQGSAPLPFLRRRALRLFPAAWVCACLTLGLVLIVSPGVPIWRAWAMSMLLLPTAAPVDPSWWTLSIELAFYLLIAVVLTGGGAATRLDRAAGLLGAGSVLFWGMTWATGSTRLAEDFGFQLTLLPHGCFFAAGVLIGARTQATWWRPSLLGATLIAGVGEVLAHARTVTTTLGVHGDPAIPVALFVGAVALIACGQRLQPVLARAVGAAAATRAGAATYPLYLLHQVAGAALAVLLMQVGCAPPVAILLALTGVTATACMVAWRAEPAIRRLLKRRGGIAYVAGSISTAVP